MIQKLFPFLFVFFIFLEPSYMGLCSLLGIQNDGFILRIYLIIVFSITLLVYRNIKKNSSDNSDINLFLGLVLFAALYLSTSVFYGSIQELYWGHFLRWGAQCVPAVLMGISFINYQEKEKIYKYIPLIIIPLTISIAYISLSNTQDKAQYIDEKTGLNYQLVAYYMAMLFCTSFFYLFICPQKMDSKIVTLVMYGMMIVQSVICTMSGGRGGFVLLVVYIIYMLYLIHKKKIVSTSLFIFVLVFSVLLFYVVAEYMNLWESAGFQRTIHPLDQNTERKDYWNEVLLYFYESPIIGNGLGSDFYTWGFYSHNILIDFLVESGIIGLLFFGLFFIKVEREIFLHSIQNDIIAFISIFAIYGIVMNMFSGYWISTYYHWLILGVYYGLKTREITMYQER